MQGGKTKQVPCTAADFSTQLSHTMTSTAVDTGSIKDDKILALDLSEKVCP